MDRTGFWIRTAALAAPAAAVLGAAAVLEALPWGWAIAGTLATAAGAAALLAGDRLRPPAGELGAVPGDLQPLANEAALESIVDALPYAIVLVDADEHIARANAAARAMFGAGLEGKPFVAYLRDPGVLDALEAAHAGAHPETVDVRLAGAVERALRVRVVPLPRATGTRPAALLAIADVTTVQQAERMRRDFVANVSHELRTPLATLAGFIETLQGPARDDAAARDRFLAIMGTQAARMTRIVKDLLSLSKIEEVEHTPPSDRVDAGRVLAGTLDALAIGAKEKGTTLAVEIANDLPPVVGDGDQLAQVFQNLVDNAIKYGRAGGPVGVAARVARELPRGFAARARGYVEVVVADDGEGIAREHLPRLTERFYRVDTGRSRDMGGTGLGLAIVKHIVNRHRGTLDIDSEIGKGTTFAVYLPTAV